MKSPSKRLLKTRMRCGLLSLSLLLFVLQTASASQSGDSGGSSLNGDQEAKQNAEAPLYKYTHMGEQDALAAIEPNHNEIEVVIPESGDEEEEDGAGVTAMFTKLAEGLKQASDTQLAAAKQASENQVAAAAQLTQQAENQLTAATEASENQLVMSDLVNNLAGAFTRKFGVLVAKVNEVLGVLNTNVHDKVRTVQEDAHDNRGAIVGHVNQTG